MSKPAAAATPSRTGTILAILAVVIPTVVGVLGGAYWIVDRRIDRLEDRIRDVTKPDGPFNRLDERLRSVETSIAGIQTELKYKARAASLGFQDPKIQLVTLIPRATFYQPTWPRSARDLRSSGLTYTIVEVTGERLTLKIDGQIGNLKFSDNTVTIPLRPGELTRISPVQAAGIPPLYIAVLERVGPDQAVVAVGPAQPHPAS